jgi:hypothetical protein
VGRGSGFGLQPAWLVGLEQWKWEDWMECELLVLGEQVCALCRHHLIGKESGKLMGGRSRSDFGPCDRAGCDSTRKVEVSEESDTLPFAPLRVRGADECVRPYINLNREFVSLG